MAKLADRNPASASGDWYIDRRCIDCGASRDVAPGLIVRRQGKSVFARQPAGQEEEIAAWRAVLVCPTASVGSESHRPQPPELFPQELAPDIYRCGYNAASSYGAHSYLVRRRDGNLLIDAPRYINKLVHKIEELGGLAISCSAIATMLRTRTAMPRISRLACGSRSTTGRPHRTQPI